MWGWHPALSFSKYCVRLSVIKKIAANFYSSHLRLSLCWCFGVKNTFNYEQSYTVSNYQMNCGLGWFYTSVISALPKGSHMAGSAQKWGCLLGPRWLELPSERPRHCIPLSLVLTTLQVFPHEVAVELGVRFPVHTHWNQPAQGKSFHFMTVVLNKEWQMQGKKIAKRIQRASENSVAGKSSAHPSPFHEVAMVMMMHLKSRTITPLTPLPHKDV